MKEIGSKITNMDSVFFIMHMEIDTRVNGCKIREKVKENYFSQMELFIKATF